VNDATVKKWADALEQKESLVQKDMELYKQNKDKIEQGMQMVKALEIREKKRMAAALEEKAKKAQAAADEAAKASAEAPAAGAA
jgi:predicted patatin/cPLA2 family phospholipase